MGRENAPQQRERIFQDLSMFRGEPVHGIWRSTTTTTFRVHVYVEARPCVRVPRAIYGTGCSPPLAPPQIEDSLLQIEDLFNIRVDTFCSSRVSLCFCQCG